MKYNVNKGTVNVLIDVAKVFANCGKDIQKNIENITLSCQTSGTLSDTHKDIFTTIIRDLEKHTALYHSAFTKLVSAAGKLANGSPEDEVLSEVLVYSSFLNDRTISKEKYNE